MSRRQHHHEQYPQRFVAKDTLLSNSSKKEETRNNEDVNAGTAREPLLEFRPSSECSRQRSRRSARCDMGGRSGTCSTQCPFSATGTPYSDMFRYFLWLSARAFRRALRANGTVQQKSLSRGSEVCSPLPLKFVPYLIAS